MRNFFQNTWGADPKIQSKRQIAEILDTDEDRVINQYRKYLNYINKVKRGLVQTSETFVRNAKQKYLHDLQVR